MNHTCGVGRLSLSHTDDLNLVNPGREQHGQVAAMGFELYTRMLRQAVAELKGEVLPGTGRLIDEAGGVLNSLV